MSRLAYPQYKPSGVAWLGKIPEHWNPVRLRYRAKFSPGRSELNGLPDTFEVSFVSMELVHEYGGLSLEQTRPLAEVSTGYTYFRDGDVLAAKITPCFENGKGAIAQDLMNGIGFGTTELHILRPHPSMDRHFLFYVTISHAFRNRGVAEMYGAGGQKRVPEDFMKNFRQPVPPVNEQRAIAAFLDRETTRIDELIKKKQRQIGLLQEKRSALISRAVTKGLDPDAKMRDSGIEGMGYMPANWSLKRLKFLTPQVTVGIVITPSKYYEDTGVPCLRSLNVRPDELTENDLVFISTESNELLRKSKLQAGDLLVVRTGKPGTAAVVDQRFDGANCIDLIIIRKSDWFDSRFMCYVLNSEFSLAQYLAGTSGAIQGHFNIETASNMIIPMPPVGEQLYIRERLDVEIGKLKLLGRKVEESITRLREYRVALISAAVTGKIDLRKEVS